ARWKLGDRTWRRAIYICRLLGDSWRPISWEYLGCKWPGWIPDFPGRIGVANSGIDQWGVGRCCFDHSQQPPLRFRYADCLPGNLSPAADFSLRSEPFRQRNWGSTSEC